MTERSGNLSTGERVASAAFGAALTVLATQRRNPLLQAIAGIVGVGLLTRAAAGHCGVKAAAQGHCSLEEGIRAQWDHLTRSDSALREGSPGSPRYASRSDAVDEAVSESFPASDPPASRLPDEPPSNAEAKWDAAKRAGQT
jgi:hypothetical protein